MIESFCFDFCLDRRCHQNKTYTSTLVIHRKVVQLEYKYESKLQHSYRNIKEVS